MVQQVGTIPSVFNAKNGLSGIHLAASHGGALEKAKPHLTHDSQQKVPKLQETQTQLLTMVVGSMPPPAAPEDKEELRIEARRQREIERLKKLGPGRLRSIGVGLPSSI